MTLKSNVKVIYMYNGCITACNGNSYFIRVFDECLWCVVTTKYRCDKSQYQNVLCTHSALVTWFKAYTFVIQNAHVHVLNLDYCYAVRIIFSPNEPLLAAFHRFSILLSCCLLLMFFCSLYCKQYGLRQGQTAPP